jgi:ammonia channel protein AmtB
MMRMLKHLFPLLLTGGSLFAQTAPDIDKRLADLDKAVKSAQSAGDNAWMLTSAALVLMMTGPGLALFYSGLVRRKNVLGTMMHSFVLMGVVTILWAIAGYSMAFGEWLPFLGATHFATAAAALAWMFAEWIRTGKPSVLGAISGAVAGLVAITPASGFVKPMPALLIGVIAGVGCYLMVSVVKQKFGYDDSLDVFGVHGIGGTLGAILTGIFATKEVNDLRNGGAMGWVDGNPGQVGNQLVAVVTSWALAIVGTFIILKICDALTGVRATGLDEQEGLDLSMHGEEGYNFEG